MATVTLEDVRKSFGKTEVIHGVGFDIEDGEFIVIVGPSGCGKSTLLRMVAGLETVTSGEVTIGGARVNDREPMDRDIAMVFQNYALYPHMSVFDNMAYGLKIAKKPKDEIRRRVDEAASLLQISDFLDRRPRELSGGQRQRVAMGRAIVRQPAVFLFDEPLSNLDAKLRVQMRMEIKTLQRRLGITALYVTHDQVEAMTLADRVVVMNAGRVEQIGSPLDVYSEPATTFVAGFIGSPPMNFVSRQAFDGARASELLPAGADDAGTIGIRPEHLELTSPDQAIMSATIVFTEALGAETLLHLEAIDDEIVTLRQAGLPDRSEPGETCHITAAPEHIRLFDANGRRIGSEPGARARTEDRT